MKIIPIGYQTKHLCQSKYQSNQIHLKHPSFQNGKHECAKFFGGLAGTLGTLGAIGGTIIMTGGVAIPAVIGYGAVCTAIGTGIGHAIDKEAEKNTPDDE